MSPRLPLITLVGAMLSGLCLAGAARTAEAGLDLSRAIVVTPPRLSRQEQTAVRMLVEEVEKRTQIRWPVAEAWPSDGRPVVAVGRTRALRAARRRATACAWKAAPHPLRGCPATTRAA
jgi:hypothetical protein